MPDEALSEKLSEQSQAATLTGAELAYVVQAGSSRRTTAQAIAALAPGTDLTYSAATRTLSSSTGADVVLPEATTTAAGLMSAADKAAIAAGLIAYVHTQATPATTWTINHNLGRYPSVELFNSGMQEIDAEIAHPSTNQTVVTLIPAIAGLARLI